MNSGAFVADRGCAEDQPQKAASSHLAPVYSRTGFDRNLLRLVFGTAAVCYSRSAWQAERSFFKFAGDLASI